jgi:hypothetical protein
VSYAPAAFYSNYAPYGVYYAYICGTDNGVLKAIGSNKLTAFAFNPGPRHGITSPTYYANYLAKV